jgi:UPF0755 protein
VAPVKSNKCAFVLAFFLICLGSAAIFLAYSINKKVLYIPKRNLIVDRIGDAAVVDLLTREKLADGRTVAAIAIKVMRLLGHSIKSGEYELPYCLSLREAIEILASGQVVIHKITIPEGFSVKQTLQRLEKNEFLLGKIEEAPEEGSLMPDTYCFRYPATRQQIISMAQSEMAEFMRREWPRRSQGCTLKTPRETLILASIVEKEAAAEREMVAGVYLNRLNMGMKLQSCPTVIYALTRGDKFGRPLKYSDLKTNNAHNTYVHAGLPPTPITNPGRSSIMATLHPRKTENLFFVSDGADGHIFSRTFEEHKRHCRLRDIRLKQKKAP